jgi:hypothetical protein
MQKMAKNGKKIHLSFALEEVLYFAQNASYRERDKKYFYLFPFRTEKLSPVTPMVLRNSGRVGSRRFF